MTKKINLLLLILTIITGFGSTSAFGQEVTDELLDKRITIQMNRKPLYTVFIRLIQKYNIAIGFEESAFDRNHNHYDFETNIATDDWKERVAGDEELLPGVPPFQEHLITVNFQDARLEDVMDSIVKQMENYDWEINDDVVNIFPIRGRDPGLEKLLEVKVRYFPIGIGAKVDSIQPQLMLFTPEFREFLKENNLSYDTSRSPSVFLERKLSGQEFYDMTFKELLNAITKYKRGGWILQIRKNPDGEGKEVVKIDI